MVLGSAVRQDVEDAGHRTGFGAMIGMSGCGTFVWTGRALQAEYEDLEMIGLALLYPALERSVCAPGHHGYPRTSDLILRKALKGR